MRIWIATALFFSLLLSACTGSPASSDASGGARWGEYRTFGFVPGGSSSGEVNSILRAEITRQLNARGFTRSNNPDLLVGLSVQTQEQMKIRGVAGTTGGAAARYQFLEDYYRQMPATHTTDIDKYTEGRLTIDLLDVQQKRMVWRGRTQGRITQEMYAHPQRTLAAAVDEILRKLPAAARTN
ncbi:protein of unknown function [Microbulbifer donghaiensis]|uniref:DUF4136 domain-containing protein n=1 Tax=Microbulbifer donghaiensis TaxID=494016 RepID=A0A1M4WG81_9GAMM|nr:DUF4136 domain-containing protein [Microbulbifer donghaiensis]SHE80258.1 protein of unknown function [Microbulbifer donghaiensis]